MSSAWLWPFAFVAIAYVISGVFDRIKKAEHIRFMEESEIKKAELEKAHKIAEHHNRLIALRDAAGLNGSAIYSNQNHRNLLQILSLYNKAYEAQKEKQAEATEEAA